MEHTTRQLTWLPLKVQCHGKQKQEDKQIQRGERERTTKHEAKTWFSSDIKQEWLQKDILEGVLNMDCIVDDIIESKLIFFTRDNGNAVVQGNVLFLKRWVQCNPNQFVMTPNSSVLDEVQSHFPHPTRQVACLTLGNYRDSQIYTTLIQRNTNLSTGARGKLHGGHNILRKERVPRILLKM